ncbi:MAG: hypothetical protein U5R49_12760 [Deltaproteobacteria bacterium]|nr:hypothetical protein [Deltaproteobacteria bacterium]
MPLDTSITNVGEYYSSHYLDSTFAKDLNSLVSKWNKEGSQAVPHRLQALSQRYFRAKASALELNNPEERWQVDDMAGWHAHLIDALGYGSLTPLDLPVTGNTAFVPALGRVNRYGKPWLVICETVFCLPDANLKDGMPSEDPLEMIPRPDQLQSSENRLIDGDWNRAIGKVFVEEESPRWIIFLAGSRMLLLDRHTYAQGRYLSFDLDDAFGRREKATFNHLAAFLSSQTLCPDGESDQVLHDRLEEQSHRFAHGVTEKLQFAVREAIELLANEWVEDRRRKQISYTRLRPHEARADGTVTVTAENLRREALIYVYRLLFCFYSEARGGELGILPTGDDIYRLGYSLESLRDLEQVPLTPATERGTYFHNHLRKLFRLVHNGFQFTESRQLRFEPLKTSKVFSIQPLTATLFDPRSTPLLDNADLTNLCLQRVIVRLSLSRDEKVKSIGRVNYAELGINQLGAVYEGLLSYTGMFAEKNLIQVKPEKGEFMSVAFREGKNMDKARKTPTWFVPTERLDEFKAGEVERLKDGKPRIYPQGTFILHLSGIDREESASYYTHHVLSSCLVEETLRELLKDYKPEDADRILQLKICEPAMGSATFLDEVAEQLAARYLELKQKQTGQTIEPSRYMDELRRVKHYIITRNAYGVDLNATAVELGALSLWLGSIHRLAIRPTNDDNGKSETDEPRFAPGATPWLGLRLRCGNSLIGARRAVWTTNQLAQGKHFGKGSDAPRLLKPGEARQENEIYHFLVFDEEMVPSHRNRLMKDFWPDACETARNWINKQVKTKWPETELKEALAVCDLIDSHWTRYTKERQQALEATACTATVWPTPSDSDEALKQGPTLETQEKIRQTLESGSGSFQRLKLLMDTWCALWFWPLNRVQDLPRRESFLAAAGLLLGDTAPDISVRDLLSARLGFEVDVLVKAAGEQVPDTDSLESVVAWFGTARELADDQHFHHWELVFPEVLGSDPNCNGFSLILGNPPWVGADWADFAALSTVEPLLGVREAKSAEFNRKRNSLLQKSEAKVFYCNEFRKNSGTSSFLDNPRLYGGLQGMRTNLYKNFIVRSWDLLAPNAIGGLLHPEGPYEDSHGGKFRAAYYRRLKAHYQHTNELRLFPDVDHHTSYSINVFSGGPGLVNFRHIANLFHPKTIKGCLFHEDDYAPVPGIKDDEGNWNTKPHCHRVVTVTEEELSLFADLLEEGEVSAIEGRLPQIHGRELLGVLQKMAQTPKRLRDLQGEYFSTQMFNETHSQRDGQITRQDAPSFQPKNT